VDGSTITAIAPPETAGTVDVTISVGGSASTPTPADRFTYL
jgi:hypothetical protein